MSRRRRSAGFGMLEAVVAMALLAIVGSALFAWINTNLDATARLRERDLALRDMQIAAAWVGTRNPMREGAGEAELDGGLALRWRATAATPVTPVAPLPGGVRTPFRAALYDVEITVTPARGRASTFTIRRLGLERDAAVQPTPAGG